MKAKDTLHVIISDLHTGSNHALFLAKPWQGEKTATIHPRSEQVRIRKHFELYGAEIKAARKNRAVRLILDGDLIDGDHHHSGDVFTNDPMEMADINITLMAELQQRIDWQRGDELYIVKGTEIHTRDFENYIGRELNAQMNGESYAFDFLELDTNGVISWFVHHGPGAGEGANEGNTMRNWLKNIYYNALKDGTKIPDVVYTGHVHNPTYSPFGYRRGMCFKNMHGIILPSWQMKTRYAWMKAPVSRNKIGGVYHEIKADGTICIPQFCIMDS